MSSPLRAGVRPAAADLLVKSLIEIGANDLRTTFGGPDHNRDETSLLASDGDHPDAAGQQRIADAVVHKVALA
jgi:lysophospholipase L1-like esterase